MRSENSAIRQSHVPAIVFDSNQALLTFSGRCIPSDPEWLFNSIESLVTGYLIENPILKCQFNLEYFNSVSSRSIVKLLKVLETHSKQGATVSIIWYYEMDDDDSLDFAKDMKDLIDISIELVPLLAPLPLGSAQATQ